MSSVMRTLSFALGLVVLSVYPGLAQRAEEVTVVFERAIPNNEGKSMVAVVVTYPPGAKTLAHHHARSAFIYVYVLSGTIRSQIDGGRWCAHSCQRLSYIIRK